MACGARSPAATTPAKVVEMDALRIVAKHDEAGSYSFESYDAEELFKRANGELDAGRCDQAVLMYDRLESEFPGSRYQSAALYNAGLCLAKLNQREAALAHFESLITKLPESPDVKHARFQAGHLQIALTRWEPAEQTAAALLARTDLDASERVEAMSISAEAQLGQDQLEAAERTAHQALTFYRTRPSELIPDPYYAAAANFVLAEVIRLRGERMAFPDTNQDEQKAVLVKRAQLLLDAQREYFNTIRHTDAHWAAAAGHRIGAMYDTLWHALVSAPVPSTLSPGAKELYPQEMAKLIKPLLRHAIRYWELTLLMVERTGVQTDWADATRKDLERTRQLLLEQPPGAGGLPARPSPPISPVEAPAEQRPQSQANP
ncbi:MAG: domain protein putative component of TonB system [Myxococcaceae bacterium]|nr:domain protein putative component of TonB system [Myxococcaceae bacterium]